MSDDKFDEAFSEVPKVSDETAQIVMDKAHAILSKSQIVYFYYTYVKGMTVGEISEMTGRDQGTIRKGINRALKKMKGYF